MLQEPLNKASLWHGKLCAGPKPVQKPPMNLPKINHIVGGTKAPGVSIWDEITRSYEVQSAHYWAGVKKRAAEYRAKATAPPYQRTCLACMWQLSDGGAAWVARG
jgi:hypothetical protein